MVCLIKSKYKAQLKYYADILGSEEAAYYVLAANNGYTLDKTPTGEPSALYAALQESTGSDESAVLSKSVAYTPQFFEQHGDWTVEGKEPGVSDVLGQSITDGTALSEVLEDNGRFIQTCQELENVNILDHTQPIEEAIATCRDDYSAKYIEKWLEKHSDANQYERIQAEIGAKSKWTVEKINQLMSKVHGKLAESFDLEQVVEDGKIVYKSNKPGDELRVEFVNSLNFGAGGAFESKQTTDGIFGLIQIALHDGDPTTIIHELGHAYIRKFWNSNAVQNALKEIDKNTPGRFTSRDIEELLIEDVTKRVVNRKTGFWNNFREIIRKIFAGLGFKQRKTAQDLITAYFIANKDLAMDQAQSITYAMYKGPVYQGHNVTERDVFIDIVHGLRRKIKAMKATEVQESRILEAQTTLSRFEHRNPANSSDVQDTVSEFLDQAIFEICEAEQYLSNILDNGLDTLNPREFMNLRNNVIKYYQTTFNNYISPLTVGNTTQYLAPGSQLYKQYEQTAAIINRVAVLYEETLTRYVDKTISDFVDQNVDVGDRETIKYNMQAWVRNEINDGKLMFGEITIGGTTSSVSPIVRMVEFMVSQANTEVRIQTNSVGHKLQSLFNKCKPTISSRKFMKNFVELDLNGKPTGYFLRDVNYGQFYADKEQFISKLDEKYNVTVETDERGNETRSWENDEDWKKYQDELDDWIEAHANRKYKAEYYKDRRKYMSRDTLELLDDIQQRINQIYKRCSISKKGNISNTVVPFTFELPAADRAELQKLLRDREQLSNPYIIVQDDRDNIVSIQEKSGDALRIAQEINRYRKATSDKRKYSVNFEKYKQVEKYIIDNYGENSQEMALFKWDYLSTMINPKLWDLIPHTEILDPAVAQRVSDLQSKRRAILDICYDKKGEWSQPNLSRLNDQAFVELKKIDEELADIRRHEFQKKQQTGEQQRIITSQGELTYSQVFMNNAVSYQDTTYIQHLKDQATAQLQHNPNAIQQYYDTYFYTNEKGEQVPLSVFFYLSPTHDGFTSKTHGTIQSIIDSPIGQFNEMDESSYYINNDWDSSDETSVQPLRHKRGSNEVLYDNTAAYNAVMNDSKKKAFYEALLNTMDEAYKKLPHYHPRAKYLLPQMHDKDKGSIAGGWYDIWQAINFTKDPKGLNDDVEINQSQILSPSGIPIKMLPVRWNRLNKDIDLNIDLIYTVTAFSKMAGEYEKKAQIAPIIESIIQVSRDNTVGAAGVSEQTRKLEAYTDTHLYGNAKINPSKQWMKRLQLAVSGMLKMAHMKLMAHNLRAILKNLSDSSLTLVAEIAGGKHFTSKDFMYATGYAFNDILKAASSIGNPNTSSKLVAAMQFSGASESVEELFQHQKNNRVYRLFKRFFCMGEYTLVDYLSKGIITSMIYHHHRLVNNPLTGKDEFMTEEQVRYAYTAAGLDKEEGSKVWSTANTTLWDAYDVNKDGEFVLNPKYEDVVRPKVNGTNRRSSKLETRIAGTVRERGSVINGILDAANKGDASRNYFTAALLQMRGWMITHFYDYYKDGHDFDKFIKEIDSAKASTTTLEQGPKKHMLDSENTAYRGQYNFETGSIERGAYRGIAKAYGRWVSGITHLNRILKTEKLTDNERHQIRRLNAVLAGMAFAILLTFLTGKWLEDDSDNKLANLAYSTSVATVSERAATIPYLHSITVLDVIKTPVVSITMIQDAHSILDLSANAIEAAIYDPETATYDAEYNNTVTSGTYKGLQQWQRNAFKASVELYPYLNVNNIYKSVSKESNRSSANYYRQIFPTNFITYKPRINKTKDDDISLFSKVWQSFKSSISGMSENY